MTNKQEKVNIVSTIPYLKTMIDGLTVEPDERKRKVLRSNAYDALLEITEMENELLTLKIQK